MRLARALTLAPLLVGLLPLAACSNVPVFPQYGPDAAIECGEEGLSCPSGEVCLQGYCYASCTATSCGPRESCVGGICVPLTGDAGTDAGRDAPTPDVPPDPCEGVTCDGATPFCSGGTCVPCTLTDEACGGATPICLVARNSCVAGTGTICQPCNDNFDCAGGATCEVLGTVAVERVCLPPCGACPTGTTCVGAVCRPVSAASCFQYNAFLAGATCAADADCAPNGATVSEGLFNGSCAGTCRFPCGLPTDCPSGVCDASGFCL